MARVYACLNNYQLGSYVYRCLSRYVEDIIRINKNSTKVIWNLPEEEIPFLQRVLGNKKLTRI